MDWRCHADVTNGKPQHGRTVEAGREAAEQDDNLHHEKPSNGANKVHDHACRNANGNVGARAWV